VWSLAKQTRRRVSGLGSSVVNVAIKPSTVNFIHQNAYCFVWILAKKTVTAQILAGVTEWAS